MRDANTDRVRKMPVPEDGHSRDDYPTAPVDGWMTWAIRIVVVGILALIPFRVEAQNSSPSPQTPSQQLLKSEELDALVAPIALFPDALVAQVLMASTYPLEEVQAERWATEHKNLHDDRLRTEAEKHSVLSLDRAQVRRRFEQCFTAERMAQDYLEVYATLLGACDIRAEDRAPMVSSESVRAQA